ncbi:MAG: site-2 protease family protein [Firmicutes bacterium]|nr:site-2 protease family protein [Bacillota bacterium]MCL2771477.1 site-2 protease family protein [Bacillota bacterium]
MLWRILDLPFDIAIFVALAAILALVLCLTVHEFFHAFVAYKLGDSTAKVEGRVTLNPIRHMDPLGAIMLLIAGFGWAKPVPVNANNFKNTKRGMALTAFSGPLSNLVLAFIFALPLLVVVEYLHMQIFLDSHYGAVFLYEFLFMLVVFNIALFIFNLIPLYPLDGFHVVNMFLPHESKYLFFNLRYGQYVLLAVIVLLFLTRVFETIRNFILSGFIWFWDLFFNTAFVPVWLEWLTR